MDLAFWINSLIVTFIIFTIAMLLFIIWWVFVLVLYAPSFRLRKLKKLIKEDNMEYNEILAEKSRLHIEKANTQLQYDKLVVQKSDTYKEIKDAQKELEQVAKELRSQKDSLDMLNKFLDSPSGKQWLAIYAAKQIAAEDKEDPKDAK